MNNQFGRKVSLVLSTGSKGIDLSKFRIRFNVSNSDFESPGTLAVRVYNLTAETIQVLKEFQDVTLNAGYEQGNYGIIFQGNIKQYKTGRENNKDNYLDIFAADGDLGFNFGYVNTTLQKGATVQNQMKALTTAMPGINIDDGFQDIYATQGHTPNVNKLLRGKTMIGMAKNRIRTVMNTLDYSWSIENGKILAIPITGYRPGEAVKINSATGLIGTPEQTDAGITATCLLNSKIRIGGLVRLNNAEITQLEQKNLSNPTPYNQRVGFQLNTPLAPVNSKGDGYYRVYAIDHEGDSRGHAWYTHLTLLATSISGNVIGSVKP